MNIKKKILKNIAVQNILAFVVAIYIWFIRITSKFEFENSSVPLKFWKNQEPFILAFWHSQLMTISFSWKIKKRINILASGHSDGRFGAIVGSYFKLNNIPTSDINKKVSLIRIFKILKTKNYIGITPDGPRGPKEKVSEGIIKIAKISKIPIIPIGFWSSQNFNLKSWDSLLITKPFSKCSFVWGEAIRVPDNISEQEIKKFQNLVEDKINECVTKAKKNTK